MVKFHYAKAANDDQEEIEMEELGRKSCDNAGDRYKVGIPGAHLSVSFQCDLCVFRNLYRRDPSGEGDDMALCIIRRINLDAFWSREPSTLKANIGQLNTLITLCEGQGFSPHLPARGPFPVEDTVGYSVAFGMLAQSLRAGRHSRSYTQFGTIRKLRSAFSNLYMTSPTCGENQVTSAVGGSPKTYLTQCPTNSLWFARWSLGCETRMGFILKQNKVMSIEVLIALIKLTRKKIERSQAEKEKWKCIMLFSYIIISFVGALRGSEGLQLHLQETMLDLDKGKKISSGPPFINPHVIIALEGRFKGEKGERCHKIALSSTTKSGIPVRQALELLLAGRQSLVRSQSPWVFVNIDGSKVSFGEMNELYLDAMVELKEADDLNVLGMDECEIREEFSIYRSFRRSSTTHAQNVEVPEEVVDVHNRWRKIERAKGRAPKLNMRERYSDIEHMIPTMLRYSDPL